jgi:DNA-binding transcriptional MocR family regulator
MEEENLEVAQGPLFRVDGDPDDDDLEAYIRLCFAWEEEELLEEGVKRLARAVAGQVR